MTLRNDNLLAKVETEDLLDTPTARSLLGKYYVAGPVKAEIRRRLERLAKLEAALETAPHAKDCHSVREYHVPGMTHYETDSGEGCPEFHFRKGKCNCWRAALEDATSPDPVRSDVEPQDVK